MTSKLLLLAPLLCAFAFAGSAHGQASTLNRAVRMAENFEPSIPRPEQDKAVAAKLAGLEKKTGKKPNIVWLLIDDMGYCDPGSYGGGKAIGADTPHMDRLAAEGGSRSRPSSRMTSPGPATASRKTSSANTALCS